MSYILVFALGTLFGVAFMCMFQINNNNDKMRRN